MNKIQRLIEQGLVIWVICIVGVVVYYFITGAYFGLYEEWFSDQLNGGVKIIVIFDNFPCLHVWSLCGCDTDTPNAAWQTPKPITCKSETLRFIGSNQLNPLQMF